MIVGSFWLYFVIARFIVNRVYKYTENIKYKKIAIAFFLILPISDVIVGYPVYKYYCYTQSGEKIFRTVDNVDGVYIGTRSGKHQSVSPVVEAERYIYKEDGILEYLEGYKYTDYKEQESGKYYRHSWLDNNRSEKCIVPEDPNNKMNVYANAYAKGRCITKQEINESEVSRYSLVYDNNVKDDVRILWDIRWGSSSSLIVPILGIGKYHEKHIYDRLGKSYLVEQTDFSWNQGVVSSMLTSIVTGNPKRTTSCEYTATPLEQILKPSKRIKNGNNATTTR